MKRIIYILLTVSLLAACGTTKKSQTTQSAVALTFNVDSAYEFCAAQCAFGPRTMNSTAHEQYQHHRYFTVCCGIAAACSPHLHLRPLGQSSLG